MGYITKENAKEMQEKAAKMRKKNTEEKKALKSVLRMLLDDKRKTKKGEFTNRELISLRLIKDAIEGDLKKIEFIFKTTEETAAEKVDVTTNGKDITIPQLVFAPTPLTEKDLDEIKRLQSGNAREEDSFDTSISETESGL